MYVYGLCMFYVCCCDGVGVGGKVCCVAAVVENNGFNLKMLKYVIYLYKEYNKCYVYFMVQITLIFCRV